MPRKASLASFQVSGSSTGARPSAKKNSSHMAALSGSLKDRSHAARSIPSASDPVKRREACDGRTEVLCPIMLPARSTKCHATVTEWLAVRKKAGT